MIEMHREIVDYATFVVGLMPKDLEPLTPEDRTEIEKDNLGEVLGGSTKFISAYDQQMKCNVNLIYYAGLTKDTTIESHYGIGLYWDDQKFPDIDIDLEEELIWVENPANSALFEVLGTEHNEIRLRTLGALAHFADSLT